MSPIAVLPLLLLLLMLSLFPLHNSASDIFPTLTILHRLNSNSCDERANADCINTGKYYEGLSSPVNYEQIKTMQPDEVSNARNVSCTVELKSDSKDISKIINKIKYPCKFYIEPGVYYISEPIVLDQQVLSIKQNRIYEESGSDSLARYKSLTSSATYSNALWLSSGSSLMQSPEKNNQDELFKFIVIPSPEFYKDEGHYIYLKNNSTLSDMVYASRYGCYGIYYEVFSDESSRIVGDIGCISYQEVVDGGGGGKKDKRDKRDSKTSISSGSSSSTTQSFLFTDTLRRGGKDGDDGDGGGGDKPFHKWNIPKDLTNTQQNWLIQILKSLQKYLFTKKGCTHEEFIRRLIEVFKFFDQSTLQKERKLFRANLYSWLLLTFSAELDSSQIINPDIPISEDFFTELLNSESSQDELKNVIPLPSDACNGSSDDGGSTASMDYGVRSSDDLERSLRLSQWIDGLFFSLMNSSRGAIFDVELMLDISESFNDSIPEIAVAKKDIITNGRTRYKMEIIRKERKAFSKKAGIEEDKLQESVTLFKNTIQFYLHKFLQGTTNQEYLSDLKFIHDLISSQFLADEIIKMGSKLGFSNNPDNDNSCWTKAAENVLELVGIHEPKYVFAILLSQIFSMHGDLDQLCERLIKDLQKKHQLEVVINTIKSNFFGGHGIYYEENRDDSERMEALSRPIVYENFIIYLHNNLVSLPTYDPLNEITMNQINSRIGSDWVDSFHRTYAGSQDENDPTERLAEFLYDRFKEMGEGMEGAKKIMKEIIKGGD